MHKKEASYSTIDKKNLKLWNRRYDDPSKVFKEGSVALKKSIKAGYDKGSAYARLSIAASAFLQSKNEIALENISEALKWFSLNTFESGYPKALNLKGNLFDSFGDYVKALEYCLQANKLAIESKDPETEAETCSQLGMIYTRLCNFIKALEFYNRALEIRTGMRDENAMASSLNRLGMIMRLINKYDESLEYYLQSLAIRKRNNLDASIPWTYLGLASTYEEMGMHAEALENYMRGMLDADKRCALQCIMGSGRIYSLTGEDTKAVESLGKALIVAQELGAKSLIAESFLSLANHYEKIGNKSKALDNFKEYHSIWKSVQSDEAQNRLRNVEISHAIEKSEQEKEIYRLKHIELKAAYDIIDMNHKEITAGINYASRIQRAILPDPELIHEFSKSLFILYIPKEIVSGDFYWFSNAGNKQIVVAADCTGHGVPGALMSMLGISFLEEIVNKRGITESGKILDELRKEVQRALRQTGSMDEARDGMDISICLIDRSRSRLQFSGANNNLFLIRSNELFEYQADRMPIGMHEQVDTCFNSTDIKIKQGDKFYMYSDGYADQFGGPNRRKYKISALKTFLLSINKLPLQRQKYKLLQEFNNWKGANPQIDDVLILGFKI
jgi:serine phosphatase RsbU (regulator of sigma subunit)